VSSPINVLSDRDLREALRRRDKGNSIQRGGYMNALFDSVNNRALDGQVLKFNTPFPYKEGIVMIEPDAFGNVEDYPVSFCIDHELETAVASTDDGLTLIVDDDGIPRKVRYGPIVLKKAAIATQRYQ
jgi:hypothetical protein